MKRHLLTDKDLDSPGMVVAKLSAITFFGLVLLWFLGYWRDIWNLF